MTIRERLSEQAVIPAYNTENNTGFGFVIVEFYGDRYQVHNTRNLIYNFGLCVELQQRQPANPYEKLMKQEFDRRKAFSILAELQTQDPALYDDILALKAERWPVETNEDLGIYIMDDPEVSPHIEDRMNVHHYIGSQAFDALVPIARSRLRHYDVGFFCR